jgi:hypothetical protein
MVAHRRNFGLRITINPSSVLSAIICGSQLETVGTVIMIRTDKTTLIIRGTAPTFVDTMACDIFIARSFITSRRFASFFTRTSY